MFSKQGLRIAILTTAVDDRFVSENGIGAVLGDKNQLMHPSEMAELVEFILKRNPNTFYNKVTLYPVCESEEL